MRGSQNLRCPFSVPSQSALNYFLIIKPLAWSTVGMKKKLGLLMYFSEISCLSGTYFRKDITPLCLFTFQNVILFHFLLASRSIKG